MASAGAYGASRKAPFTQTMAKNTISAPYKEPGVDDYHVGNFSMYFGGGVFVRDLVGLLKAVGGILLYISAIFILMAGYMIKNDEMVKDGNFNYEQTGYTLFFAAFICKALASGLALLIFLVGLGTRSVFIWWPDKDPNDFIRHLFSFTFDVGIATFSGIAMALVSQDYEIGIINDSKLLEDHEKTQMRTAVWMKFYGHTRFLTEPDKGDALTWQGAMIGLAIFFTFRVAYFFIAWANGERPFYCFPLCLKREMVGGSEAPNESVTVRQAEGEGYVPCPAMFTCGGVCTRWAHNFLGAIRNHIHVCSILYMAGLWVLVAHGMTDNAGYWAYVPTSKVMEDNHWIVKGAKADKEGNFPLATPAGADKTQVSAYNVGGVYPIGATPMATPASYVNMKTLAATSRCPPTGSTPSIVSGAGAYGCGTSTPFSPTAVANSLFVPQPIARLTIKLSQDAYQHPTDDAAVLAVMNDWSAVTGIDHRRRLQSADDSSSDKAKKKKLLKTNEAKLTELMISMMPFNGMRMNQYYCSVGNWLSEKKDPNGQTTVLEGFYDVMAPEPTNLKSSNPWSSNQQMTGTTNIIGAPAWAGNALVTAGPPNMFTGAESFMSANGGFLGQQAVAGAIRPVYATCALDEPPKKPDGSTKSGKSKKRDVDETNDTSSVMITAGWLFVIGSFVDLLAGIASLLAYACYGITPVPTDVPYYRQTCTTMPC